MTNDLISREAAKEAVKYIPWCDWEAVGRTLDELEAVDAAPVVHGMWINQDNTYTKYECSACKERNFDGVGRYCPNCGAKMDKEESDV